MFIPDTFSMMCFLGIVVSVLKSDGVVEGGTGELHKKETAAKEKQ